MAAGSQEPVSPGLTPADLAGTWAGAVEHDGESARVALHLEPGEDGRFTSPSRAYLRDLDGHEISLYWAGKARLRRTVMRDGER